MQASLEPVWFPTGRRQIDRSVGTDIGGRRIAGSIMTTREGQTRNGFEQSRREDRAASSWYNKGPDPSKPRVFRLLPSCLPSPPIHPPQLGSRPSSLCRPLPVTFAKHHRLYSESRIPEASVQSWYRTPIRHGRHPQRNHAQPPGQHCNSSAGHAPGGSKPDLANNNDPAHAHHQPRTPLGRPPGE
ncbi:hypothetical protein BT67DRAFT_310931 [Trichocladium antarcticum]|uniref:Uncharacterized protein n=1 Tax=Trichocladium antarcticum TaxID=1450529 RepID=A0AAN6ZDU8_9PEZI|nr:hypothetical protein BT67DRAFT_310931 [Trichocladium antarcticum]